MRLHRFYFPVKNPAVTMFRLRDVALVHQIRNVFRMRLNDLLILIDGSGNEFTCKIHMMDDRTIELHIVEKMKNMKESLPQLWLFLAILKRENFELVAQKVTELGIHRITPLHTARTIKQNLNEDRLKKIITEAAEQSGRGIIPSLASAASFSEAIGGVNPLNTFFFDESGDSIHNPSLDGDACAIFIGPEGGWSDEELGAAKERNFMISKLNPFTLRAETAAIVATAEIARYAKDTGQ